MVGIHQNPVQDMAQNLLQYDAGRSRRTAKLGHRSFWTKQRDGSVFVTVQRRNNSRAVSVEVLDPVTHSVQHFKSLRQFWRAMGKTAPVSLRRYTGQEHLPKQGSRDGTLLDLLGAAAAVDTATPKLGIDLVGRGHEVKKLMWAGFGNKILRAGYDPDDVLQEVFRGIVARNHGTCPWDARKSSFGHYVHMVIGCVLTNYHRKQQQVRGTEVLGVRDMDGKMVDAAGTAVAVPVVVPDGSVMDSLLGKLPEALRDAGRAACLVLSDGGSLREAQRACGLKQADFESLMRLLRA